MNRTLLIDQVVRQTMVLIAHLATQGGARAPLSDVAESVFRGLVDELAAEGVSHKVIADMFGLALRTYYDRVKRITESHTLRGRSLWEAVFEHVRERGSVTRAAVLQRFRGDDEAIVKAVLHDLVESGLVARSGRGEHATYLIVPTPACGGGLLDPGEECDDANAMNGDGCSAACRSEGLEPAPRCGDGALDEGEVCDDGNNVAGDGCSADCASLEVCGNGVVDPSEECDDGNAFDGDACGADCRIAPLAECGNGLVDPGEVCDDGNNASGDGCSADCASLEVCGNAVLDPGEECDDGNAMNGDGCSGACILER